MMRESTGRRVLAECLVRMVLTDTGGVIDMPDAGLDVRHLLRAGVTDDELGRWQSAIAALWRSDERVEDVAALTLTTSGSGPGKTLTIASEIASVEGTFPLVIAVSALTAKILEGP
jgi:hypothetical protein